MGRPGASWRGSRAERGSELLQYGLALGGGVALGEPPTFELYELTASARLALTLANAAGLRAQLGVGGSLLVATPAANVSPESGTGTAAARPRSRPLVHLSDMPVQKRSFSLDEQASAYLDRRAKQVKRSASAVLSELVSEAARQDARDRALQELGAGVEIPDREVDRWLKKLGAL